MKEVYLGDGAYAKFDGYGIILTTSDGINITNTIYLEPSTLQALEKFVSNLKGD